LHVTKSGSRFISRRQFGLLPLLGLLATVPATAAHGQTMTNASNEAGLMTAIIMANALSSNQSLTVNVTKNITFGAPLPFIQMSGGAVFVINGNDCTLNAASNQGLVVLSGEVKLTNLAITNALSYGGDGQSSVAEFGDGGAGGGGGGAGMGGALFIGANAIVEVGGLTLNNNDAVGGVGGAQSGTGNSSGGGGVFNGGGSSGGSDLPGAPGGFGGGGGGGGNGGANNLGLGGLGGFGGGIGFGDGGTLIVGGAGGLGGYGGGGGGGGGADNYGGFGGGGAGRGGAVFVQSGGQFIVSGSVAINGNTVLSGDKGDFGGSAFGSGIFLQGNGTLTFAPGAEQFQTIGDNIADETGSDGGGVGATGQWGIVVDGPGTLVLSGLNTYSGDTLLLAGTLEAPSANALGSGSLILATGARLKIDNDSMTGPLDVEGALSFFNGGATLALTACANSNPAIVLNTLLMAADSAEPFILNVTPAQDFTPEPGYQWTFLTTTGGIEGLTDLSAIQTPLNWAVKLVNGGNDLALVYVGPATPPIITSFSFNLTGCEGFQLTFTGPEGNGYRIWASTNLDLPFQTAWTLLTSGTFGGEAAYYKDPGAINFPRRFYRITVP
jgi:hypothetical protein